MELPTTKAPPLDASERIVPEFVIWLPGVRVCAPTTKAEAEFAVMVELPTVITGGEVGWEGKIAWVAVPPTIKAPPLEASEYTIPD
jgi:hypothetical protein